jgi:hypothetical protein
MERTSNRIVTQSEETVSSLEERAKGRKSSSSFCSAVGNIKDYKKMCAWLSTRDWGLSQYWEQNQS